MEERLQKILSTCGVTSRRQGEQWITQGRVKVNGQVANLGDKANLETDLILVDDKPINKQEERFYYMLNKPRGFVTTLSDEQGRKTVADLMKNTGTRLWPVGRLDVNSEGLLIMTNDGNFTHTILHPSHQVEKEYQVWVRGDINTAIPLLSAPMTLDGEQLSPAKVKILKNQEDNKQLSITIHQGKNRQVRRMCAQVNLSVLRLKRIREGSLLLDHTLKTGCYRPLTHTEVSQLQQDSSVTKKGADLCER